MLYPCGLIFSVVGALMTLVTLFGAVLLPSWVLWGFISLACRW